MKNDSESARDDAVIRGQIALTSAGGGRCAHYAKKTLLCRVYFSFQRAQWAIVAPDAISKRWRPYTYDRNATAFFSTHIAALTPPIVLQKRSKPSLDRCIIFFNGRIVCCSIKSRDALDQSLFRDRDKLSFVFRSTLLPPHSLRSAQCRRRS